MRFPGAIRHQIRLDAGAPAFYFPDSGYPAADYAGLDRMTRNIAGRLAAQGIGPGLTVALDFSNEHLHAAFLVACARSGVATISASRRGLPKSIAVAATLTDKPADPADKDDNVQVTGADWLDGDAPDFAFPEIGPGDLCRIMLTSGSTGEPKATFLTYAMVQERLDFYSFAFGRNFTAAAGLMCSMKLSSSLGFGFLLHCLTRGGLYSADSATYETIVRTIATFDIRALVASPTTLAEIVAYRAEHGETGQLVHAVYTSGSRISPELENAVREKMCRALTFFYGATETGVVAVRPSPGVAGDVGYVVPGKIVDILTAEGDVAPAGVSGRVRIRDRSGCLPFRDLAAQQNGKSIEAHLPGDVGELDGAGRLIIQGRADNIINSGGVKISPEILEQVLVRAPGIRDCGLVTERDALGVDRITAFLVLTPGWQQEKFLAYCEAKIDRNFLPAKFVTVKQIPRTHNGKIDRHALSNLPTR